MTDTNASTAVERHQASTAVASIPSAAEWAHMERVSSMFAKSSMCPQRFKEKPDDLMVIQWSLRPTGVEFTLNTLNQCYVIDGKMEMMAQIKVAIAAIHGWDVWFEEKCADCAGDGTVLAKNGTEIPCPWCAPAGAERGTGAECDDRHARVHYTAPGKPTRRTAYDIGEARAGHLLDEWVERWISTGEKWPDGKPKNRKEKVVVSIDGVPVSEADMPAWAVGSKDAGPPQRKDPWFANRGAMLMARAITKGLRYAAPHLMLGIGDTEMDPPEAAIDDSHDLAETGEMIPVPSAKRLVLLALQAQPADEPLTEKQAAVAAGNLWSLADLPNGRQMVARSRVDALLSKIPAPAPDATPQTPNPPGPLGGASHEPGQAQASPVPDVPGEQPVASASEAAQGPERAAPEATAAKPVVVTPEVVTTTRAVPNEPEPFHYDDPSEEPF